MVLGRLRCFSDACFWSLVFGGTPLGGTPLGGTGCLGNPYFLFTGCLSIQFFDSTPFFKQSVRPLLATFSSLWSTCMTYTISFHAIGHQTLPMHQLLRKLWIWESVFYHQTYFTLHFFLLLLRSPWARQFTFKGSRGSCWLSNQPQPNYLFESQQSTKEVCW